MSDDEAGMRAMLIARKAIFDALLKAGADPEVRDGRARRPARAGSAWLSSEKLSRSGGEVTMRHGPYALLLLAVTAALLLLVPGDARAGPRENEMLVVAVAGQSEKLILDALRGGADVNARNQDGYLALNVAARGGSLPIVRTPARPWRPRERHRRRRGHGAALGRRARAAGGRRLLLARGAAVSAQNDAGITPLHFAAALGAGVRFAGHRAPDARRSGLRSPPAGGGAAVDARDKAGRTPLITASTCGNVEVAKLLLAAQADLATVDANGAGVVEMAVVVAKGKGLGFFLDRGADPNVKNAKGFDVLNVAWSTPPPTPFASCWSTGRA